MHPHTPPVHQPPRDVRQMPIRTLKVFLHGMFGVFVSGRRRRMLVAVPENAAHLKKIGRRTGKFSAGLDEMKPGRFKLTGLGNNTSFGLASIDPGRTGEPSAVVHEGHGPDFEWNQPFAVFELPLPLFVQHYNVHEYQAPGNRYLELSDSGATIPKQGFRGRTAVLHYVLDPNENPAVRLEDHQWRPTEAELDSPNGASLHLFNEPDPSHVMGHGGTASSEGILDRLKAHENDAVQDLLALTRPTSGRPPLHYGIHNLAIRPKMTNPAFKWRVTREDLSELVEWPFLNDSSLARRIGDWIVQGGSVETVGPGLPPEDDFILRIAACEGPNYFFDS